MRVRQIILALSAFFVAMQSLAADPKSHKDIAHAPLPRAILEAKRIFIVNDGGNDSSTPGVNAGELVYDLSYKEIKEWNRYEIVDAPEKAELVFHIGYARENQHSEAYSRYDIVTKRTTVHSSDTSDPTLRMTIVDPKTQIALWGVSEIRKLAYTEKGREKNLIDAAKRLIASFRSRVDPGK